MGRVLLCMLVAFALVAITAPVANSSVNYCGYADQPVAVVNGGASVIWPTTGQTLTADDLQSAQVAPTIIATAGQTAQPVTLTTARHHLILPTVIGKNEAGYAIAQPVDAGQVASRIFS